MGGAERQMAVRERIIEADKAVRDTCPHVPRPEYGLTRRLYYRCRRDHSQARPASRPRRSDRRHDPRLRRFPNPSRSCTSHRNIAPAHRPQGSGARPCRHLRRGLDPPNAPAGGGWGTPACLSPKECRAWPAPWRRVWSRVKTWIAGCGSDNSANRHVSHRGAVVAGTQAPGWWPCCCRRDGPSFPCRKHEHWPPAPAA